MAHEYVLIQFTNLDNKKIREISQMPLVDIFYDTREVINEKYYAIKALLPTKLISELKEKKFEFEILKEINNKLTNPSKVDQAENFEESELFNFIKKRISQNKQNKVK